MPRFLPMPRRRASLPASWPPASGAPSPRCGLCERAVQATSRHHLVPREEGGRHGPTVDLCQPCHSSVHRFLSNRALAREYATVEALRAAEELQTYLRWVKKQRVERITNRRGRT
ncbi:HNH endonuclease [Hymenobacter coccineus]|nr:HNH endonuclease [Hymenobacter coccineus]